MNKKLKCDFISPLDVFLKMQDSTTIIPQVFLFYNLDFNSSIDITVQHKVKIIDIDVMRSIEDAILNRGLDIAEKPDSYVYFKDDGKSYVLFLKNEKPINKLVPFNPDLANCLSFFSEENRLSMIKNYKTKVEMQHINIFNIIYVMRYIDILGKEDFNKNDVIVCFILSNFELYTNTIKTHYDGLYQILEYGDINKIGYRPAVNVKTDMFVCRIDEIYKDIIDLKNKYQMQVLDE